MAQRSERQWAAKKAGTSGLNLVKMTDKPKAKKKEQQMAMPTDGTKAQTMDSQWDSSKEGMKARQSATNEENMWKVALWAKQS